MHLSPVLKICSQAPNRIRAGGQAGEVEDWVVMKVGSPDPASTGRQSGYGACGEEGFGLNDAVDIRYQGLSWI